MSLVIAVARERECVVVSDGAVVFDGAEGGRRLSNEREPKFRVLNSRLVLTATGDSLMIDGCLYPQAKRFVERAGNGGTTFGDLAEFLTVNLPKWHRSCEDELRKTRRLNRISFDGAAVMLTGFDQQRGCARLIVWLPLGDYEMQEFNATPDCPAAYATGLSADEPQFRQNVGSVLLTVAPIVGSSGSIESMLKAVIKIQASKHQFIGDQTFSATVSDPG
jgi:hypothetical protein